MWCIDAVAAFCGDAIGTQPQRYGRRTARVDCLAESRHGRLD
jgi:hypothetical protein